MKRIAAIMLIVGMAAFSAPATVAYAETKKLGLEYLTASQRQELWTRADDNAGYAALLHLCNIDVDFERRFVAAVEPCVTEATIHQVVTFYRKRYTFTLAHANKKPCSDPGFMQLNLPSKMQDILNKEVASAQRYCGIYRNTSGILR